MYGFKQISISTKQLKFKKTEQDTCLFVRQIGKRKQNFLSWVDDILVFTEEDNETTDIKNSIEKFVQIDDQRVFVWACKFK